MCRDLLRAHLERQIGDAVDCLNFWREQAEQGANSLLLANIKQIAALQEGVVAVLGKACELIGDV